MTDVLMPALSPTMEEGTLAKWHVKVGDTVRSGDVIAEIETDKATMEVEAVDEGVVEALLVPEGTEEVKVNTPIARLKGEGEARALPQPRPPKRRRAGGRGAVAASAGAPAKPAPADSAKRGGRNRAPERAPQQSARPPTASREGRREPHPRLAAWPAAWRSRPGSTSRSVKGSGPHGRIIQRDLEGLQGAPREARRRAARAAAPKLGPPAAPRQVPVARADGHPAPAPTTSSRSTG